MLFDTLDEEHRKKAIRFLEESLFGAVLLGAHYFHDLPPTYPGFNLAYHGSALGVGYATFVSKQAAQ